MTTTTTVDVLVCLGLLIIGDEITSTGGLSAPLVAFRHLQRKGMNPVSISEISDGWQGWQITCNMPAEHADKDK